MRGADIDAIILAAGLSRRMGRDKLLLPFRGRPLLLRTLDLVLGFELRSVTLVTRAQTAAGIAIPPAARLVLNTEPERGQSHSLRLGLESAATPSVAAGFLFFTADQPLLDEATVRAVLAGAGEERIVHPARNGRPGSPVFFPARFRRELLELDGDRGGREIIRRHPSFVLSVEATEHALLDADSPEDYRRLCAI